MNQTIDDAVHWHDDGHVIWLELNKSELVILGVNCPNSDDPEAPCRHRFVGCMVDWFMQVYGLECNVGVCEPSNELQIAWTIIGDTHDLDVCQCWIIPTSDDVFSMWAATQRGSLGE
jgi:hypothetical protein